MKENYKYISQHDGNREILILRGVEPLLVTILNCSEKEIEYTVENTPICQFDQHSRARIGIEFLDYKVSEKPVYIFYSNLFDKVCNNIETFVTETLKALGDLEEKRNTSEFKTEYNLMSRSCSYRVKQTWDSLKGQMSRRLKMCEEEFIVGLHWELRDQLIKLGYTEAEKFVPFCDVIKNCDYSSADYLSNMFGCLFAGCGRWPDKTEFASFNFSCTTRQLLEEQLNIKIPLSYHEEQQLVKIDFPNGCEGRAGVMGLDYLI